MSKCRRIELLLILPFLAVVLLTGVILKGCGRNWDIINATPTLNKRLEHDLPPWLASYEGKTTMERQAFRHRKLKQVCNSTDITMIETLPNEILVNDQNNLVYCFIPKTGSTRILNILVEVNRLTLGLPKEEFPVHNFDDLERYGIKRLNTFSKEEQADILRNHYKFLFVRHPLLRLKSAHEMFAKVVQLGYSKLRSGLLRTTAGLLNGTDWRVKGFPQFDTFVRLISSKWKMLEEAQDHHWNNFQDLCLPCYINYDFMGRHEYFVEELNYVLENRLPKAEPVTLKVAKAQWIELEQISKNLSKETYHLFFQRYHNDFHLFNYKI